MMMKMIIMRIIVIITMILQLMRLKVHFPADTDGDNVDDGNNHLYHHHHHGLVTYVIKSASDTCPGPQEHTLKPSIKCKRREAAISSTPCTADM